MWLRTSRKLAPRAPVHHFSRPSGNEPASPTVLLYTMAKPMNHERRLKALERTRAATPRNEVAIALARRGGAGAGRHADKKKQASKNACRGKVDY